MRAISPLPVDVAFFSGTIRSQILGMDTGLNVVLPYDRPMENQQSPCKVIYLLHGLGNRCDAWCRNTNVERFAREKGVALIMPEAQRSMYMDMKFGMRYFSYVSQELPELCAELFNISTRRGDTFIAGLSMGGYGAMRCALTFPEQYAAVGSFSGAIDLKWIRENLPNLHNLDEKRAIFGMELEIEPEWDILRLADKVAQLPYGQQPRIFITCGKQDYLYECNIKVRDHLRTLPLSFRYEEWDGDHEWDFWEQSVKMAMDEWI